MVRWLAPGMKAAEFEATLGSDWAVGSGKVDWFRFGEGKVARK